MTEEEKLLSGLIFNPLHPELIAIKRVAHNLCARYNQTFEDETAVRTAIIGKLLKKAGEGVYFQGPIQFNYGCHTSIGDNFFANFNFTVSDDATVTIGNNVMIGPNTTIATPAHPLLASERNSYTDEDGNEFQPCFAKPIVIGDDVWIASGVIICGGVTIGSGSVIGAGSIVIRDIPAGVLAAGNPCRVIRKITEADSIQRMFSTQTR